MSGGYTARRGYASEVFLLHPFRLTEGRFDPGLDPRYFTVMRELNYSLFIKDRRDGTVKIIDKMR